MLLTYSVTVESRADYLFQRKNLLVCRMVLELLVSWFKTEDSDYYRYGSEALEQQQQALQCFIY